MANDCCAGIFVPLDNSPLNPVVVHKEEQEFRKKVFDKNPNVAMVDLDILEDDSNAENEGSGESNF